MSKHERIQGTYNYNSNANFENIMQGKQKKGFKKLDRFPMIKKNYSNFSIERLTNHPILEQE